MKKIISFVFIILCSHVALAQQAEVLAPQPPMGWNSWNWFGKQQINEKIVRQVIDSIANNGLQAAGYNYIVVDGGWRDTTLTPEGKLKANSQRFPHGMKALADYAHSKGLKFGLHTVPGTHDCGGDPVGGFGHEKVQIQQFVNWGLDFIKLDKCIKKPQWTEDLLKKTYFKWRKLLNQSDRNILLSISAYKFRDWYPEISQMARTTGDINSKNDKTGALFDSTSHSVMKIAEINDRSSAYAGDGYWNDPDMLAIGNQGLTIEEQKVHFALWCIMSAPLILGNDPRYMSSQEKAIITNKDAIAIDQDPIGQGARIKVRETREIWAKQLSDGRKAVLLINGDDHHAQNVTLSFNRLGIIGKVELKDVYGQKNIGTFTGAFTKQIRPQSGLFLIVKRVN